MTRRPSAPRRHDRPATIAPAVMVTVARLTALGVAGVARLAAVPGGANRLFRRGVNEGVRLEVNDDSVALSLHLVLLPETDVRAVARQVQADVARAIEETVGMTVSRVDVHVEDVDYGTPPG